MSEHDFARSVIGSIAECANASASRLLLSIEARAVVAYVRALERLEERYGELRGAILEAADTVRRHDGD